MFRRGRPVVVVAEAGFRHGDAMHACWARAKRVATGLVDLLWPAGQCGVIAVELNVAEDGRVSVVFHVKRG